MVSVCMPQIQKICVVVFMLVCWSSCLKFIRNVAAHHSRLWNINVLELSPLPSGWPMGLNSSKPFFYFCLMRQLLGVIYPNSTWAERVVTLLQNDFPSTPNGVLSLNDLGCVADWAQTKPWVEQV
jgi:abortive infection bacteriophage resistance protein